MLCVVRDVWRLRCTHCEGANAGVSAACGGGAGRDKSERTGGVREGEVVGWQ